MKIKIRPFLLKDLAAIVQIDKVSFPEPWPKEEFERCYKKYPQSFVVAQTKEEVVGYLIGYTKNRSGWIKSIAVKPEHRKKGIGKALLEWVINHFKEKKIKEILAHVRTKNEGGISFYQKFDFKIIKTIEKYYPNGDDAYLMRKEL